MKKIIPFLIVILFVNQKIMAQNTDQKIKDIHAKVTEIINGKGYETEQQAKPGGGVCFMYIDVKKKDGQVRRIHAYDKQSFDYQFFYWNDKVIFIFVKKCIPVGDQNTYRCFEYRHFFDNDQWFKTDYTQYIKNQDNKIERKQRLDMFDFNRAYNDMKKAEEYLSKAKAKNWYGICGK